MQLVQALFLLLAAVIAASSASLADQAPILQHRDAPENSKPVYPSDEDPIEERGPLPFMSKLYNGVFRKNTGLGKSLDSIAKNPSVVAALENNPGVKRMEVAMKKDPNYFTKLWKDHKSVEKLAKDPDIARFSSTVNKADAKFINKLMRKIAKKEARDKEFAESMKKGFWAMMHTASKHDRKRMLGLHALLVTSVVILLLIAGRVIPI